MVRSFTLAFLVSLTPLISAPPDSWTMGSSVAWGETGAVFQKGKESTVDIGLAADSSTSLILNLHEGSGQAEFTLRDGEDEIARVGLRKDKTGENLPLHTLEKGEDRRWRIAANKSQLLTYRPSERALMIWKNLNAAALKPKKWFEQDVILSAVRRNGQVELYVDGVLAMAQELPDTVSASLQVTMPAGDILKAGGSEPYLVPSLFQPLALAAYLPGEAERLDVVDRIPFLRPEGKQSLDLREVSWPLADEMPSNYFAAYDSGPMFLHDVRNPTLWAPRADYSAIHLLVRPTPDAKKLGDRFSVRLGSFGLGQLGGRGQILQHDYHAAVPKSSGLQVLTIPVTELVSQDLESSLQIAINKELRLARRSPDPSRFEFRPLGVAPGLEVFGVTLERSPVQIQITTNEPGQVFEGTQEATFRAQLENITAEEQSFTLRAVAKDSEGKETKKAVDGKLAPHERREVFWTSKGSQWGYYDLDVTLEVKGADHPLRRRTSFALLPPDTRQHRKTSPFGTWTFDGGHKSSSDPELLGSLLYKAGIRFGMGKLPEDRAKWGVTNNFEVKGITEPEKYEKWKRLNPDALPVALLMHEHSLSADHVSRVPDAFTGRKPYKLSENEQKIFQKLWDEQIAMAKLMREHYPDVHLRLGNGPLPTKEEFLRAGFPAELFDSLGNEAGTFGRLPETQPPDWVGNNSGLWMDHELLKAYGYDKPVTQCYEIMYPSTNPGNLSPHDQAAYFVRHGIHSTAWGIPEIRFGLLDDVANAYRFSNWGASGMVNAAPHVHPKPSYVAVATMTQMLDGANFQRALETGSRSVYAVEFSRAKGPHVYVLWTVRGEREVAVHLDGKDWTLTDWEGNSLPLPTEEERGSVTLTNMPIYLTGNGTIEKLVPGKATYHDQPAESAQKVASLDSLEDWKIETEADPILEFYDPLTPRRLGNFSYAVASDADRPVLQVTSGPAPGAPTLPMYGSLKAKKPIVLPGEPTEIGLWVDGNSGWGRVIFELVDANGQKWTSIGASRKGEISEWMLDWMPAEFAKSTSKSASQADWNTNDVFGLSSVNFDGWRYVRFPLPGNYPGEKAPWPANSQWRSDKDGVVHYPLKLSRLIFELPENVLKLTDYEPVKNQGLKVKDLTVEFETQGAGKVGVYENDD